VLQVLLADHPHDLLPGLVDGLNRPPSDPFAPDWVLVPSLGMRAWLSQELSKRLGATGTGTHDGVAANIRFPFPGSLRWTFLAAAGGSEDGTDPWQEDRLVWSVLEILHERPAELDGRLVDRRSGVALAARAQAVASLFDGYNVHRRAMVEAWADGRDVDVGGAPLEERDRWQPRLYRLVHESIRGRFGVDELPSVRLERAVLAVRDGDPVVGAALAERVPDRLFVFGQSIWGGETGPILEALAVDREVAALVPSPSVTVARHLVRVAGSNERDRLGPVVSWATPRAALEGIEHPLLASWGVRPLETAVLMGTGGLEPAAVEPTGRSASASLLGRIQADLRAGVVQPGPPTGLDRSLQVHGAPGRTRQVEVLRDVILDLLAESPVDGPPLAEADIAVVCHRLDEFAPLIGAVWGPSTDEPHRPGDPDTPTLRYSLVDRSSRTVNPVIDALTALLDLVPGRMDRAAVRDLLSLRSVQQRFGLGPEDLELFDDWVDSAGVRWGVDGEHRGRDWHLPADYQDHTWAAGIVQLAAGAAAGEALRLAAVPGLEAAPEAEEFDLAVGGCAITTVADGRIEGATRIIDALCTLVEVRDLLLAQAERPVGAWAELLRTVADRFVATDRFADWQRLALDRSIEQLVESSQADGHPSATGVTFADLRRLLTPLLDGSPPRTRLGVGGISIARPSQLAGVPYRVVCVLGLDADALPVGGRSGDDLGARSPLTGDRDVRSEARAELLAVLTTATDAVVVTHNVHDVRTNVEIPRTAVLDELLATLSGVSGVAPDEIVVVHPRQAFDPSNFDPGVVDRLRSYDVRAARAASVLRDRGAPRAVADVLLVSEPLPGRAAPSLDLEDLRRFHRSPVERFLRDVLAVSPPRVRSGDGDASDDLPLELSGLDRSDLGRRLLEVAREAGTGDVLRPGTSDSMSPAVTRVVDHLRACGALPPPSLAIGPVTEVATAVADLYDAASGAGHALGPLGEIQVDVTVGGRRLSGVVRQCTESTGHEAPGPVVIRYTRPKAQLRLSTCIDLLVLTLQRPDVPWRALLVTRPTGAAERRARNPAVAELATLRVRGGSAEERKESANRALAALLDQYDRGHTAPLPLFPETSAAYHLEGQKAARATWGDPRSDRAAAWLESVSPINQLAFGVLSLGELVALEAAGTTFEDEARVTWGSLVDAVEGLPSGGDT